MSAFENFIQLEIPKRPYLEADPALETIMVRRGAGPRQLSAVALTEGQVLAYVGGALVGTTVASLGNGVRKAILNVAVAGPLWTINHALNSKNAIIQITDADGYVVLPSEMQFVDNNTITISFGSAQAGVAKIIFLD